MECLNDLFDKSNSRPIKYNGDIIVLNDEFPVNDGDELIICIEETNSQWVQGIVVDVTGECEVNGTHHKQGKGMRVLFWEDTEVLDPKHMEIKIFTKKSYVKIYNMWETKELIFKDKNDNPHSKMLAGPADRNNNASMIVEEIENGRRYRCSDGPPPINFNNIIFTITKKDAMLH